MEYFLHLFIIICIYLILAQSFNLVFGLGGLLNIALVSSFAIGAYTTALFSTDLGLNFIICVYSSAVFAAFLAIPIGAISLRLSQDYFLIGTLAFSSLVSALLVNWKSLTRGVLGIPGIPRPSIFGLQFNDNLNFALLVFIFAACVLIFVWLLFNSPLARALRAQAESDYAARALAKDTTSVRNAAFIISSGLAGLSGSLFAYYINYIDPSSFGFSEMVFVLSIVIIGKPGSFWGVIASTFFLVLLPEPLRFLEINPSVLGPMRQLLYALILFGVLYWKREKLFPIERVI